MAELGAAQSEVAQQQKITDAAHRRFLSYGEEYEEKKQEGMTVVDCLRYQGCLDALDRALRAEEKKLAQLQEKAESKRLEVVAARQETFSLEKLKEIRRKEYDAAVAKQEEKALDDLTIARRMAAQSA